MQNSGQPTPPRPETAPVDIEPVEPGSPDLSGPDRSMDPEDMTLEDMLDAEDARPDLPDETSDGLDDMDEEIRRQAEDLPIDAPGRQ